MACWPRRQVLAPCLAAPVCEYPSGAVASFGCPNKASCAFGRLWCGVLPWLLSRNFVEAHVPNVSRFAVPLAAEPTFLECPFACVQHQDCLAAAPRPPAPFMGTWHDACVLRQLCPPIGFPSPPPLFFAYMCPLAGPRLFWRLLPGLPLLPRRHGGGAHLVSGAATDRGEDPR